MDQYTSWPDGNRAAQQEVSGGPVNKASSVFTATLHCLHYCLCPAPSAAAAALDSLRRVNPNPKVEVDYPETATK